PRTLMISAYWREPVPVASAGVAKPLPGTGDIRATSANSTPVGEHSPASSRLSFGADVFRSAQTVGLPRSPTRNASVAAAALFTLSTTSAPVAASASSAHGTLPSGASTAGSYARTVTPALTRSAAIAPPASPRPSTAMTGVRDGSAGSAPSFGPPLTGGNVIAGG